MQRTTFQTRAQWAAVAVAAVLTSACGLDKQTQPSLIGPAQTGLAINITATPDQLPRDGSSQSVVTVSARDAQGRAIAGQRLSVTLGPNAPQGASVSVSEIVTNSNGQATFTVQAPAAGSFGDITVFATPIGSDAANTTTRIVSIRALPQNNAAPQFSANPFLVTCAGVSPCITNPEVGEVVTFDGSCHPADCSSSGVTDEGAPCNSCTFTWNFGGDGTASGQIVTHAFGTAGTYIVTETVRDAGGVSSVAQRSVTVVSVTIPTGLSVSSSPNPPIAKQPATFTASATVSQNHRIVSYQFIWGDGDSNTSNSPVIQHTYSQSGPFLLTLTVRDDLGQSSTANIVITVDSGLTATFTVTPAGPAVGVNATFDASGSMSRVASTITNYAWDFDGNGSTDATGPSPTATFAYTASGTYNAKLTITDNRGVTQTATRPVIVP